MATNHKYGTRGKSKLSSAKTFQVSVANFNATQDVTNELNDIIVNLPNSSQCKGNTVSPSVVRAASRERERINKMIVKSVPAPPPRFPAIKNKAGFNKK